MTIIKKEGTSVNIVSTSKFNGLKEFLIIKEKKGHISDTVRRRGDEDPQEDENLESKRKILEEARISGKQGSGRGQEEKQTVDEEKQTAKIKRKAAVEEEEAAEENLETENIEKKSNIFSKMARNFADHRFKIGKNVNLARVGFAGAAGAGVSEYARELKKEMGNSLGFIAVICLLKIFSFIYYGIGNVFAGLAVMGLTLVAGNLFGFFRVAKDLDDNKILFFFIVIDGILPLLLSFKIFYQSQAAYVANYLLLIFTVIPWSVMVIFLTMNLDENPFLKFLKGVFIFASISFVLIMLFQIPTIAKSAEILKSEISSQVDTDLAAAYTKQAFLDAKQFGKTTYSFLFGPGLSKAIADWNKGLVSYAVPGYDNTKESEAPKTGLWIEQSSVGQSLLFSEPRNSEKGQTVDVGARVNIMTVIPADLKIYCYSKKNRKRSISCCFREAAEDLS